MTVISSSSRSVTSRPRVIVVAKRSNISKLADGNIDARASKLLRSRNEAVKKWLQSDDAARQKIVASYFVFSPTGGWEDIGGEQLAEVKVAPPTTMEGFMGKFQAAVGKWAVNGDPMFVVTATKV